jgi:hypothetical protein
MSTIDPKLQPDSNGRGPILRVPLETSGTDASAAAFQLCVEGSKSDTWSIQFRRHEGSVRSRPSLRIEFTNYGDFSLQAFVRGTEKSLPIANSIPCVLTSRKIDKHSEHRLSAYDALIQRSTPFEAVRDQVHCQRDKRFLQRIVNEMCQDPWDRFRDNCFGWENSSDATVCRKAITDQVQTAKGARQRKSSRAAG